MRRLFWIAVGVVVLVALATPLRAEYVLAPLLGLAIWRVGVGSLASFRTGAAHIPSGDPSPVDLEVERTVYWCQGCGAELLLLIRGTETPPRHCGERMTERSEIARDRLY
jgi:hypothetical protein